MDILKRLRQRVLHGDARLLNPQGHDPISMKAADEIERLRRIIWNLLDDGDEADRAAARAALKGDDK